MPKIEFKSNAKPSLFGYTAPLEEKKKDDREKVATAVLSIAARAKKRGVPAKHVLETPAAVPSTLSVSNVAAGLSSSSSTSSTSSTAANATEKMEVVSTGESDDGIFIGSNWIKVGEQICTTYHFFTQMVEVVAFLSPPPPSKSSLKWGSSRFFLMRSFILKKKKTRMWKNRDKYKKFRGL